MSVIEREELRRLFAEYRLLYKACTENGNIAKARHCAKVSHDIRRAIENDKRMGRLAIQEAR